MTYNPDGRALGLTWVVGKVAASDGALDTASFVIAVKSDSGLICASCSNCTSQQPCE